MGTRGLSLFSAAPKQAVTAVNLSKLPALKILKATKFAQFAYLSADGTAKEASLAEAKKDQVDGFPKLLQDKSGADAYVWLSKASRQVHLAYRGTETSSMKDILTDANAPLVPLFPSTPSLKAILVHQGFSKQFTSLKPLVDGLLEQYKASYDSVVHTGHSLGAALSTLSAVSYARSHPQLRHICINIGCPRAGNKEFGQMYRDLVAVSHRIANENDPIPLLPLLSTYQHVQEALTITDDLKVTLRSEVEGFLDREKLLKAQADWSRNIAGDHSSALYAQRLETLLKPYLPSDASFI